MCDLFVDTKYPRLESLFLDCHHKNIKSLFFIDSVRVAACENVQMKRNLDLSCDIKLFK